MKEIIPGFIVLAAVYFLSPWQDENTESNTPAEQVSGYSTGTADTVFRSGAQAQGSGVVIRILSDDNDGSQHQRFILRLSSGQTLLIAHNIDLAPRVSGLREGDTVSFNGEYESNSQGGVILWTHHDPAGRHAGGWLMHKGRTYQ